MPRPRRKYPPILKERIQELLKNAKSMIEMRRIQCIALRILFDMKPEDIAKIVGYSDSWVKTIFSEYYKYGESAIVGRKDERGGRYNESWSYEEEKKFMTPFLQEMRKEEARITKKVYKAYTEKVKRRKKVDPSIVYKLMKRHNCRMISEEGRRKNTKKEDL